MATQRILYFTAGENLVYRRSGGELALEARFGNDEPGVAAFKEHLQKQRNALYAVLADIPGEDYHEEQIPALRGGDRETVIQRRLAQRYRDTRLAAALSAGIATGERRNERLLLTSFTNTQQFVPWLDALAEARVRLTGVYSVPLIAPALAVRLGAREGPCIVVSANRAGLRQSFVSNGRLRFSRLEQTVELAPDALSAFVRSETLRLGQYLSTLRVLPREGPPVQVVVVAPAGERAAFERTLVSDARYAFITVEAADAARMVGLKRVPADTLAEALYLFLALKKPPKEQFASRDDRRGYLLWQLQRLIAGAGAVGLAACALYAATLWIDLNGVQGLTQIQRSQARIAADRYQSIVRTFPVTQTTTDNLKITVDEFTRIAQATASPEPAMLHLSRVLEQFPHIELESLTWRMGRPEASLVAARPAITPPGAKPPAAPTASEVVEISGRVGIVQRSDYRAITEEVQRFADALVEGGPYSVIRTQLPFDVTSEGTLTGDIREAAPSGDAPRFTLAFARNLP